MSQKLASEEEEEVKNGGGVDDQMAENINFKEHLNAFNKTTDQLDFVKIKYEVEVQALLILSQMPENWKCTVSFSRSVVC
ncbi:hypothetical protein Q3G72_035024 [Acer saccharum]|nr:hypothetical protein Q3G72_035024 [Acer saccharum]